MGRPSGFRPFPVLAVVLLALLVSSCRTLPEGPYPAIVDWIPPESDIVIRMNVVDNPDLTDMLLRTLGVEPGTVEKIRHRTAEVAVGLELAANETAISADDSNPTPTVHLASVGRWPRSVMGSALGPDWAKSGAGKYRWTGPAGLELAAVSREEIILSAGRADQMLERIETSAFSAAVRRTGSLMDGSDVELWLTDPSFIASAIPFLPSETGDGEPVIECIAAALRRNTDGGFALQLNLYPSDDRLTGSLALALRLGLSARFGLSGNPEERDLMTGLAVDMAPGIVALSIPRLEIGILESLLGEVEILPEAEQ